MLINQNQKKKIPDISNLVKKSDYNTKVSEIEGKISSISNLATTAALTTVETKIPSTSNLVKKTDYDTKVKEIEKKFTGQKRDKYITIPEFNKLAADIFAARLKQTNLVTNMDFNNELSSLNRKTVANKTKDLAIEKEFEN